MPHPQLDRSQLKLHPLAERRDRVYIERDLPPRQGDVELSPEAADAVDACAAALRVAREADAPRMLAFGAHTIKNCLGPLLIELLRAGWLTHLATNGAGVIHDWELAFQGHTSEDVAANVAEGRFGLWKETGRNINLALLLGALDGLGYGESIGRLISTGVHDMPSKDALAASAADALEQQDYTKAAAAADLLAALRQYPQLSLEAEIPHPYGRYSLQAAAWEAGVPFTAHPMIGHDIIYEHPLNSCAAIGRCAQRDFLAFAHAVSRLSGGVYLSIGSAVMSPMVFEKSMAMAQNLALQQGHRIENHRIFVVDLQESQWDWRRGEPPEAHPDYYLRFNKSFSRMGGELRYCCLDNRAFLHALAARLL